jgi:hypothetical protein
LQQFYTGKNWGSSCYHVQVQPSDIREYLVIERSVGRFTVGSKLVIDGKNNDGKDQRWQRSAMAKNNDEKNSEIAK